MKVIPIKPTAEKRRNCLMGLCLV